MLTAGWVFGAMTAAAILVAAVGLLLTALRNRPSLDTGPYGESGGEVTRAREAWRDALLERGILPFLQAALAAPGTAALRRTTPSGPSRMPHLGYDSPGFSSPDDGPEPGHRPSFTSPDFSSPDFGGPNTSRSSPSACAPTQGSASRTSGRRDTGPRSHRAAESLSEARSHRRAESQGRHRGSRVVRSSTLVRQQVPSGRPAMTPCHDALS